MAEQSPHSENNVFYAGLFVRIDTMDTEYLLHKYAVVEWKCRLC